MMSKRQQCLVHYQTQAHQLSDVQKKYDAIKGDDKKQEKALAIQGELPHVRSPRRVRVRSYAVTAKSV